MTFELGLTWPYNIQIQNGENYLIENYSGDNLLDQGLITIFKRLITCNSN